MRSNGLCTVLFLVFQAAENCPAKTFMKVNAHPLAFESAQKFISSSVTSCLNEATEMNERLNALLFMRPINGSEIGLCQMLEGNFLAVGGTSDLYEDGYAVTSYARFDPYVGGNTLSLIPLDGSLRGSRSFQACP